MFLGESGDVGVMGRGLGGGENENIKAWARERGIEMSGRRVGFKGKTGDVMSGRRDLGLEVVESLVGGDRVLGWGT